LHSGVVDALIDKTKNIELLVGIVVLLDDTMERSGICHHKYFMYSSNILLINLKGIGLH